MRNSFTYNSQNKRKSRFLRRNQTDAEKELWRRIRARQLSGFKFRRQFPIDHYILDFYCKELELAIELDGSQHLNHTHAKYDRVRTIVLSINGIKILRFYDNDVLKNITGMLESIYNFTKTSPQPSPTRRGGD